MTGDPGDEGGTHTVHSRPAARADTELPESNGAELRTLSCTGRAMRPRLLLVAIPLTPLLIGLGPAEEPGKSPDQDLPQHITRLTRFGERADWSHDGRRILFVEKTFGDAYVVDLETKTPRLLTGHYPHLGYTR